MKIRSLWLLVLIFGCQFIRAQQTKPLTLQEAVNIALENSDEAKIADSKVTTAASELSVIKNNQYPDASISGQYLYLTEPNINLKFSQGTSEEEAGTESGTAFPDVNQMGFVMGTVQMPLFSGFKLHNMVKAGESNYEAEVLNAKNDKEAIALRTITGYINLYKANRMVELIEENLKSAKQRVTDFTNMEENGLLARNDRLKAELQESNIQISLEEAKKNQYMINYQLVTLLKLPAGTVVEINDSTFGIAEENPATEITRYDLEAMAQQQKAAMNQIKVAQSAYYPTLFFSGGYVGANVKNALTISNAFNVGLGVSYNLSDIFKAKSDIRAAKSKAETLQYSIELANDQVKVAVENAKRNYQLALKKLELYTKSEEQANENYRIVKDKYDNGLVDTNDLLEADVQRLQSKIDLANAKADITKTYYELLNTEGQLTNNLNN
ncbi:Outer membrane protein TolC [Pustulibacterium marinum]|uniref:Outer membrane protein TolC n=1 Tax=Pustulibacterium marinum TaxID=1224947 RepID=A0A1I7HPY6_9FLAO|nr:TolC family protein [Pustulibacterium marinum]SFU62782.1 Outer membrane protein TolC [Pustulibacterium marinum]